MSIFRPSGIVLPLVSVLSVFALSAQAQENRPQGHEPSVQRASPNRGAQVQGRGPQDARYARAGVQQRNFGGHVYHGRQAWEAGRWRHEVHNGRLGWWWDVGGVWYYYPAPVYPYPNPYEPPVAVVIPQPPPAPAPIAPIDPRILNAAIPISDAPNPPARPFRLAAAGVLDQALRCCVPPTAFEIATACATSSGPSRRPKPPPEKVLCT